MDPTAFSRITAPPLIPSPATAQAGAAQHGATQSGAAQSGAQPGSFAALLGDAEQEMRKLLAGEPVELHRVMLASEQARLASDLLMAVRNKVIDAYQEVMRIQI
jgi:flagellar hook-basal body complex protein FliE